MQTGHTYSLVAKLALAGLVAGLAGCVKEKPPQERTLKSGTQVGIASAKVERILVGDGETFRPEAEPMLVVRVEVRNRTADSKIDYRGFWRDDVETISQAWAADDRGNVYRPAAFAASLVKGQVGRESVYPNTAVVDLLPFEIPVAGARWISVCLDGDCIGLPGEEITLGMPASQVEGLQP